MEFLFTLLSFVVVLSIVVFVHEYGHYIVGRWCGIKAETFSVGMGPAIGGWTDRHGTRWQIAAIPLGGYVKFVGDANAASAAGPNGLSNVEVDGQVSALNSAALWRRALTVAAGPVANFLLSIVIYAGLLFSTGIARDDLKVGAFLVDPIELQVGDRLIGYEGQEITEYNDIYALASEDSPEGVKTYTVDRDGETLDVSGPYPYPALVAGVSPLSAAANAGVLPGDEIIQYGAYDIASFEQLKTAIIENGTDETILIALREGDAQSFEIKPQLVEFPDNNGGFEERVMLGVTAGAIFELQTETPGLLEAARIGVLRTVSVITSSVDALRSIIRGDLGADNLQGPIGIARVSADLASSGLFEFIAGIALISTAIGFVNLFPIPVLDGGHLMFYAYEAIRGKPPQERIAGALTAVGLSLMLCLFVFVTYNDVLRLLNA